ncbi:trichohyalin-like [Pangasianodon hypophthalmus]|uniref:trichohyalin-like n=1 Tax=Pangasianodon hypophthalmus TaxID=310915 RepID=UPI00230827E4|nr:trichohyalin-like [Pangasianodon hypophthalmus]
MRLEMETARVTERQISEAREKAKRETEIQTEKQTEIKTQQEKRQRKQEMEKQREEEELKRNLEMLKTRMKNEEQEYNEMHRVIQKELEKDNLKKEPKESEREEEMENENEKMAENMAVKEKCKWIEMQFDKERKVVEERAMALLEKSERTGESNRQDMDRQKMEKERQIGGELQINNTKIEREKQKVTEQKEKQRKVEEHFWDTANLAKSEEIKKLSPKNEESFEIDLELQSQMGERNQRKEAMLMETEKQRDEEPMKERQERQLKIQQMQEARQKHAERQTKRKRELMQKLFPQIVSPSLQKEGDGGKKTERRRHRIPLNKEQQQESSEQGKEHQEQVELQSDRRNRQLDKMKKGIQTVLQEMNRQKAMERLQIKERQEEIKGQLKVKTSERQDMKRQLMEKERQVRKESQINKTEIEREKQKVLVTEQEEKQRTMEEHLWDTESLPKFDEIQKCSSKYEEKLNERNQRKKEMLLETEKQRDEEPMKDRQARLLKIQQMQEARQKHAEKQTKRKRELMLKIFSQRMSPVYKEHQHKHQQEHQLEHQQESSEPEQKNQEQVRFQRPVSSSGVWLINIKPLESSKGPAEQQMKLDQLSTSAPETQPEESVRDKSSYDPEDPEPQALTQPKTVEEQSLETSVPPDGSEDSGEMAVEMKDVTSQDTESEKRDGPKHKSIRRRIFGWINKKLKESHKNAIAKSFETEKKHGDRRYLMRNTRQWTTEAAIQQQKREGLQKKEKKREELEARWRAWEEKRAKKKEEKKEEEKRKAEEEHEIPHLKTYAYCYIR